MPTNKKKKGKAKQKKALPVSRVWSHFSAQPFVMDYNRDTLRFRESGKRDGLWLSDETDTERSRYTWSQWCVVENYCVEKLAYKTDMKVDMTKILVVDGTDMEDMKKFHENYYAKYGFPHYWIQLQKEGYKGLAIAPYDRWKFIGTPEYTMMASWYYGWDVPSIIIWNFSCIQEIGESVPFQAPTKNEVLGDVDAAAVDDLASSFVQMCSERRSNTYILPNIQDPNK